MASTRVIVELTDGRVLFLRRGPTDPWLPGHWNLPGGKIDLLEEIHTAASRELLEETGLPVEPSRLVYMGLVHGAGRYKIHVFYTVLHRTPIIEGDGEHDYYEWLWDTPSLVIPGTSQALRLIGRA